MVTPLDVGLLKNFQVIFPFLLIFCITYGILTYTKIFGENRAIHAMIALVLAFMSLFSDIAVETINTAAPWFVLLVIFIVFLMLGFMIIGVREADILKLIKDPEYHFIGWWIVALVLIIVIGSLSHTISAKRGGYPPFTAGDNVTLEDKTQESAFWKTLFHPKVLGFAAIMLIAFITVNKLTSPKQ
jgi:hypothetical protein